MRSAYVRFAVIFLLVIGLIGCGEFRPMEFKAIESVSCLSRVSKVQQRSIGANSFFHSPVQLPAKAMKLESDEHPLLGSVLTHSTASSQKWSVNSQVELLALLDNECVLQGEGGDITELATSQTDLIAGLSQQSYAFSLPADMGLSLLQSKVREDQCLIGISDNREVKLLATPNDQYFGQFQGYLRNINAEPAWDIFNANSAAVIVAVVDSGVDYTHRDLAANMWQSNSGTFGIDLVNSDNDPMDDLYHGTHVAGLIGAQANNNEGISGIVQQNIRIMAVKVADASGSALLGDLVNGIRWAADNGADVVNLSLGGRGTSADVDAAVQYAMSKGAVVVVAAGNDGELVNRENGFFPTNNGKLWGTIAVASTNGSNNALSGFSNFSPTYVDIAAPGEMPAGFPNTEGGLLSTTPGDAYEFYAGTSFSAPLVSGAAAMAIGYLRFKGLQAGMTPSLIETLVVQGARTHGNLNGKIKNARHLDLLALAQKMERQPEVLITEHPTDRFLTVGAKLELHAAISGTAQANFQWQKDGVDIPGATGNILVINKVDLADGGQYRVRVIANSNTLISEAASVRVFSGFCDE